MLSKLLHITLALLLLISSSGLVLSQHFCLGALKSSVFFTLAQSCHSPKVQQHKCPHHSSAPKQQEPKKGCCDTTVDFLQLDDEQLVQELAIPNVRLAIVLAIWQVFLQGFTPIDEDHKTCHYLNYKPPLLVCDCAVHYQTFLC